MKTGNVSTWRQRVGTQEVGHHQQPSSHTQREIYFGMTNLNLEEKLSDERSLKEKDLLSRVMQRKKYLQTTMTSSMKHLSETTRIYTDQSLSQNVKTERSLGLSTPDDHAVPQTGESTIRKRGKKIHKIANGYSVPTLGRVGKQQFASSDLLCMTTQMLFNNISEAKKNQQYSYSLVNQIKQDPPQPIQEFTVNNGGELPGILRPKHKYQAKTPRADFFATFSESMHQGESGRVRRLSTIPPEDPHTEIVDFSVPTQQESSKPVRAERSRQIKLSISLKSKEIVESMLTGHKMLSKQHSSTQVILEDGNSGTSFGGEKKPFLQRAEESQPGHSHQGDTQNNKPVLSQQQSQLKKLGSVVVHSIHPGKTGPERRSKSKLSHLQKDQFGKSLEDSVEGMSAGITLGSKYPSISAFPNVIAPQSEGPSWPGVPSSLRRIGTVRSKYRPKDGLEPLGQSFNEFYKRIGDSNTLSEEDKSRILRKVMSIMHNSYSAQDIAAIEPEILERMLIEKSSVCVTQPRTSNH